MHKFNQDASYALGMIFKWLFGCVGGDALTPKVGIGEYEYVKIKRCSTELNTLSNSPWLNYLSGEKKKGGANFFATLTVAISNFFDRVQLEM